MDTLCGHSHPMHTLECSKACDHMHTVMILRCAFLHEHVVVLATYLPPLPTPTFILLHRCCYGQEWRCVEQAWPSMAFPE